MAIPMELPNLTDTQKAFNQMQTNLLRVNTDISVLQESDRQQNDRLDDLEKIVVRGDGDKQLSHAERIRLIESYVNSVKDTIKYWGRFIGGALLLNFLGLTGGMILAVVKFLPILEALAKK